MTAKEIEEAALRLPLEERERLMEMLKASVIREQPDPEIDQAWAEEAERRLKAYDEGRIKARPVEETLRDLRKKLK